MGVPFLTIGLAGGINNYQYADNPTGWIDPLGLCKEEATPPSEPGLKGVFPEAWLLGGVLSVLGRAVKVAKSVANRFPKNADDLLSELPRDAKGRIYPSSKVRIRPEQHSLKRGETYAPRHHGQHYHVETRADPAKSWNNKKNVTKIKPPSYQPGQGTGFLLGEKFPGAN